MHSSIFTPDVGWTNMKMIRLMLSGSVSSLVSVSNWMYNSNQISLQILLTVTYCWHECDEINAVKVSLEFSLNWTQIWKILIHIKFNAQFWIHSRFFELMKSVWSHHSLNWFTERIPPLRTVSPGSGFRAGELGFVSLHRLLSHN